MSLNAFRNGSKSFASKIMLTILALSFVGWGIGDYLTGGVDSTAIEVNGEKISIQELSREFDVRVANVQNRIGQRPTPEIISMLNIGQQSINGLVRESILQQTASELELRVSDNTLRKIIVNTPSFQGEDGKFSEYIYKAALRENGYTREGYEQILRDRLARNSLSDLFISNFNDSKSINRIAQTEKELIDIQVLTLSQKDVTAANKVTDNEVKEYFEANRSKYMSDETRDFDVLSLTVKGLAKTITVGEAELKEEYEANIAAYTVPEMRKASHILFKKEEEANNILTEIKAKPDNFADLAAKYSKDKFTAKKGGDLGFFNREDMEKKFSDAAYSMQIGEISDVVKSAFGYHIIKLEKIRESRVLDFSEAKSDIELSLKEALAEDAYFDLQTKLEDAIAGGSTLAEAAKELSLPLDSYKNKTRNNTDTSNVIFSDLILPAAYDTPEGEISDAVEMQEQTGTIFVQVNKVDESSELSFAESASKALIDLKYERVAKALKAKSDKLLAEQQAGQNLDKIARNNGLSRNLKVIKNINRYGENAPKWLQQASYITALFGTDDGKGIGTLVGTGEGIALVSVVKHHTPSLSADDIMQIGAAVKTQISFNLVEQFIQGMLDKANVNVNNRIINYALGERGFFKQAQPGYDLQN